MRKNEKKVTKSALALALVVLMLASVIPLLPVSAAVPGKGVVPVNDYFLIEAYGDTTCTVPESLLPGQVWTGKSVDYDGDGTFTVKLYAWGKLNDGHLLAAGTNVRIEDTVGPQFEVKSLPVGAVQNSDKVTCTFTQEEITGASPAVAELVVTLKAGWDVDTWYYTNDGAAAYFTPSKDNRYYWVYQEVFEDAFHIDEGGISWNQGNDNFLNNATVYDDIQNISFFVRHNDTTTNIGGAVYTNVKYKSPNTSANGQWGWFVDFRPETGNLKTYSIWYKTASGELHEYLFHVNNPGGSEPVKGHIVITTTMVHHKVKNDAVWQDDDNVVRLLPETGKLILRFDLTKVYKVTYDGNGGGDEVKDVPVDDTAYVKGFDTAKVKGGTPVRRGYDFTGWNTQADGSGDDYEAGEDIKDKTDVTLYAQWKERPRFIINYDANEGAYPPSDPGNPYYEEDGTLTILGKGGMSRPGYDFVRWNTKADGSGDPYDPDDPYAIPVLPEEGSSVTLYAQWEPFYTVKYNTNGGSGTVPVDSTKYADSAEVTVKGKGNISKGSDKFIGWNTSPDGSGIQFAPDGTFIIPGDVALLLADDNSVTLYAQWTPTYKVTYNRNGASSGTAPTDVKSPYEAGADVTVLGKGSITRSGYTFMGWSTKSDGTGTIYQETDHFDMPAADVTLYAVWQPNNRYKLLYDVNGGTGTPPADATNYTVGQQAVVKPDTDGSMTGPGGKVFVGWNTQRDGKGKWYYPADNLTMPDSNVTLYAQWADESDLLTVTYDGNGNDGGTAPADGNKYIEGADVTVKTRNTLTRDGYIFVGWNTKADGTGDWHHPDEIFNMPDDNVTLYAQWTDEPVYEVKYDGNGSTGGTEPVDGNEYIGGSEAQVKDSNTLVRAGWRFVGWTLTRDGSGKLYKPGDTIEVNGDLDLYAQWESEDLYTVTYDANGGAGQVPTDATGYAPGDTVTVMDKNTLARTGHTFLGWNTERDGSGVWYNPDNGDEFTMPDENVTLYAQWDPRIWFKVIYDANGGSNPPADGSEYTPDSNVDVIFSPPPSRAGYTFRGWSTNPEATTAEYTANGVKSFVITDDTTLYAVWAPASTGGGNIGGGGDGDPGGSTTPTTPPTDPGTGTGSGTDNGTGDTGGPDNNDDGDNTGGQGDGDKTLPNIDFPDGKGPDDFPEVDFGRQQPDRTRPGGTDRGAPPVPNTSGYSLTPQYNDDGDLVFVEFDDFGVPLGEWYWDDPVEMWVFDEYPPLGGWEMPQTGSAHFGPEFILVGLFMVVLGIHLNGKRKRKAAEKTK